MLGLIVHMSVCISRRCVLSMPQLLLHSFHAESEAQKHRCAAVTKIMESDIRQIIFMDDLFECFCYIVRAMQFSQLINADKSVKILVVILS